MQINLSSTDLSQFRIKTDVINGQQYNLIIPKELSIKWDNDNLIFRSSVWDNNGNPVSLSFKKFFNYGEKDDLIKFPEDISNCSAIEKIDGSTLIISKHNGNLIIRTRGTLSAYEHSNASDIDYFKEIYPKVFDIEEGKSYIYEWYSPSNRIILSYGDKPKLFLTNIINHEDYSYMTQNDLNLAAKDLDVERPIRYNFSTKQECLKAISELSGVEGICFYSGDDQFIHKVKSIWYLNLHRLKSNYSSIRNLMELYFANGQPSYDEFEKILVSELDYELAKQTEVDREKLYCAIHNAQNKINVLKDYYNDIRLISNRKDQAAEIFKKVGKKDSRYIFMLLDNKQIDFKKVVEELLEMC